MKRSHALVAAGVCMSLLGAIPAPARRVGNIWEKRFGGAADDAASVVARCPDGGFLVGGNSASGAGGDRTQASRGGIDYWVVRTDAEGNKLWDRRFGGNADDYLNALVVVPAGGFLLGGASFSGASGDRTQASRGDVDFWVVRIDAAGNKLWDRRFGGAADDTLFDAAALADGGFLLAGYSASGVGGDKTQASQGGQDMWVVKIDAAGTKQWDRRYGGSEADVASAVRATADGGYLLCGYSMSGASGDKTQASRGGADYWVVRVDGAGNKLWDRRFGGTGADLPLRIGMAEGDGYILAGQSASGAGGDKTEASRGGYDYWLVAIDGAGNKLWDRRYGGSLDDDLWDIGTTGDGYVVAGASASAVGGDRTQPSYGMDDVWIVRTDFAGNKRWDRRYGGSGSDEARRLVPSDNGFLLAGRTMSSSAGDVSELSRGLGDFWLLNVGMADVAWDVRFGGTAADNIQRVAETADGGCLAAGMSSSGATGNKTTASQGAIDYWVVRLDAEGSKLWEQRYGGSANDQLWTMLPLADDGYLLGGTSLSGLEGDKTEASRGINDYWIVRIDSAGVKQWDHRFGGADADMMTSLASGAGGGFLLGGYSRSGVGGDKTQAGRGGLDYWIVKTTSAGVKQWDRRFGGSDNDFLNSVVRTADGGYYLVGSTQSPADGDVGQAPRGLLDYWVVKVDGTGNKVWDRRLGGDSDDELPVGVRTLDGGILVVGESFSGISGDKTAASPGEWDLWAVRLDAAGNKLWDRTYGGAQDERLNTVVRCARGGGFLLGGMCNSDRSGHVSRRPRGEYASIGTTNNNFDAWIVRINEDGDVLWEGRFGGTEDDTCVGIGMTRDGGAFLGCLSESYEGGDKSQDAWNASYDYWVVRLDPFTFAAKNDFDGDGKTDIAVFRPATAMWYIHRSLLGALNPAAFGVPGDLPAPADYDGDGVTDFAVFRTATATWYVHRSSAGGMDPFQYGAAGDLPVPADYDGDGRADVAVFRPAPVNALWHIFGSRSGAQPPVPFGLAGDLPVAADYDGDGRADPAVFQPATATWGIDGSSAGLISVQYGAPGDLPAPGDFDGDGLADWAVFRPATATWYIHGTLSGAVSPFPYGTRSDVPLR